MNTVHPNLEINQESNREQGIRPENGEQARKRDSSGNGSVQHGRKQTIPDCPHQSIVDLYHETLPTLTRHVVWNETRRKNLQARWRESAKRQNLDWWKTFFDHVAASDFLMGRTQARDGRPPFQADLEWLTKPGNFAKVVEGKYHQ